MRMPSAEYFHPASLPTREERFTRRLLYSSVPSKRIPADALRLQTHRSNSVKHQILELAWPDRAYFDGPRSPSTRTSFTSACTEIFTLSADCPEPSRNSRLPNGSRPGVRNTISSAISGASASKSPASVARHHKSTKLRIASSSFDMRIP